MTWAVRGADYPEESGRAGGAARPLEWAIMVIRASLRLVRSASVAATLAAGTVHADEPPSVPQKFASEDPDGPTPARPARATRFAESDAPAAPGESRPDLIAGAAAPTDVFEVDKGQTRLLMLKERPRQIQFADDAHVGFTLLGDKELSVLGKKTGSTVLTMWFPDPEQPLKERIVSTVVRVVPDREVRERLDKNVKQLQGEFKKAFPEADVKAALVGWDRIVVTGRAKDDAEATRIVGIVRLIATADADDGTRAGSGEHPPRRPAARAAGRLGRPRAPAGSDSRSGPGTACGRRDFAGSCRHPARRGPSGCLRRIPLRPDAASAFAQAEADAAAPGLRRGR